MEQRELKPLPNRKGESRHTDLPLEIVLDILRRSAWSSTTKHARRRCKYARRLVEGGKRENRELLITRQKALQTLYINNTLSDAQLLPGSASFLTMILTVAKNLHLIHFEEHWSDSSSWVKKEKTIANRLVKNPLRHIACVPSLIGKVKDNGSNTAFAKLPPKETRKPEDWVHLGPKLSELTISAHTLTDEYMRSFDLESEREGLTYDLDDTIPEQIKNRSQLQSI